MTPGAVSAATAVPAPGRRRFSGQALADSCAGALVVVAYMLSQANEGLRGDARIYMGRTLADLDPAGVGRDLMFVHDGQSGFSIFRLVSKAVAETVGFDAAITVLTLAAAAAWALAMLALVHAVRPGRATVVVLAAALLLPRVYTPWNIIAAGEALAEPRPFAEAAVLLALAGLLSGRRLAAVLLLALAAAIHPLMALPGAAVLAAVAGARHWRRWLLPALAAAGTLLVAGALGAPLLSRLFVPIDPAWLAILHQRNSYLFLRSWPAETLSAVALQLLTVLIASRLVDGPLRLALRASVAVGVAGCVLTLAFADTLPLLLVVQVQPWRALWVAAALAPLAAGLCLWKLPAAGPRGSGALALLAAGWVCIGAPGVGPLLGGMAFGLLATRRLALGRWSLAGIYAAAALASVPVVAANFGMLARYLAVKPTEVTTPLLMIFAFAMPAPLMIALALAWTRHRRSLPARALSVGLLAPALVLVAARWEDRGPAKIDVDGARLKPDLVRLLASRPGEVLWLGSDELWYWTRRTHWNTRLQGGGIVFSRELALIWEERARAVVAHGLADEDLLDQWKAGVAHPRPVFDRARIDDLCRRPDAPAWVVQPLAAGAPVPSDPDVAIWTSPFAEDQIVVEGGGLEVRSANRRAIVPCAPAPRRTAAR